LPNKQLTARVRLDASSAHRSLDKLISKIKQVEAVANKQANVKGLEKSIERALLQQEKLKQATLKTELAQSKVAAQTHRTAAAATQAQIAQSRLAAQNQRTALLSKQVANTTKRWATNQAGVTANLKTTNSLYGSIWHKLKGIAATYLGIMGVRAVTDTTDLLVGAQNRLNYVAAGQLGEQGYNTDGTYSDKTLNITQDALDKMYVSSQKVRTSYQGMISNVSKTMTLAGDAFKGNIDNAIRFQEVMAEAYAVGGASAQEMHNSMYQLTQALGSGVLQGDELRSVREGAPLAYQAIEKFAQGVYNTTDSLKDMASEGKITSDMVVAAVMDMGKSVDKAFGQTRQTFGQTFDQIKNSALYAFQPVMEMLTDALNKAIDNGMIQRFEALFTGVAKGIMIVCKAIELAIRWISDNWYWLQYIFYSVVLALIGYLTKLAAVAIWTALTSFAAFLAANPFIIWIVTIGILVAALVWLLNASTDACEFIVNLALTVAKAIVGVLMVVLAVYLATGAVMMSIPVLIGLLIVGIIAILIAVFVKFTGEIIGGALGIWEVIKAVCSWVENGWKNMCNGMAGWFWNAIADMLDGVDWLLKGINKVREALGKDTINIEGIRAKADSYKSKVEENNLDIGAAWDKGYSKGYDIGTDIQDKINGYGEKIKALANREKKEEEKTSMLDKIGKKLNLNFEGMGAFPTVGVGSDYEPDVGKMLKGIGDDTGKIADSMDLTSEDLEYLRRIADMEWKKEYTTAEIKVEMNNNNQINGDGDLDGIVTRLADKLYEEMNVVANGVYAY